MFVLISVFNIINSIAMSVSAHTKQYGAMRAIGMSDGQLIAVLVLAMAVAAAVYMPVKKIKRLSIMETIGEL